MEPLISVIVPVYKVEKYLNRCIESIVNQTYQNLEIILVDDGSPDNCGQMCDNWSKKDNRIKVIHKKNGGLSDARNQGSNNAVGKFITFIDSDDCILPEYIEYLFNNLIQTNSDISCCDFQNIYDEFSLAYSYDITETDKLSTISGREACFKIHDYSVGVYFVIAPCKLYKTELIKKHPFPIGLLHEDEATTYKLFFESERICVGTKKLYAYFQNSSSITHNKTQKNYEDLFYIFKSRTEFFNQKADTELEKTSWDHLISFIIYSHLDFKKRFRFGIIKFALQNFFVRNISSKSRLKFLLYSISPILFQKTIKIFAKNSSISS